MSQRVRAWKARLADRRSAAGASPSQIFRWAVAKYYPLGVLLLVVCAALGAVFRHRLNWGDVPTWVLAATTFLAFVAAAFAGVVAYELLRVEQERDRLAESERAEQRLADQRAQASKVAAWFGTWQSEGTFYDGQGARPTAPWPRAGAIVRNASDLPVHQVRVSFCIPLDPAGGLDWRGAVRYSPPALTALAPPGDLHVEFPDGIRGSVQAEGDDGAWLVAIEFTDAAGNRWVREPLGRLEPLSGAAG